MFSTIPCALQNIDVKEQRCERRVSSERCREKDERCARWVRCRSHQEDLDSTDDVHGRSDARAQVEEHADGAAELGTERARDEEVRAATRNHAVRRDRAHADRRRERLQQQPNTNVIVQCVTRSC